MPSRISAMQAMIVDERTTGQALMAFACDADWVLACAAEAATEPPTRASADTATTAVRANRKRAGITDN
jgi:hypothetical protein